MSYILIGTHFLLSILHFLLKKGELDIHTCPILMYSIKVEASRLKRSGCYSVAANIVFNIWGNGNGEAGQRTQKSISGKRKERKRLGRKGKVEKGRREWESRKGKARKGRRDRLGRKIRWEGNGKKGKGRSGIEKEGKKFYEMTMHTIYQDQEQIS